MTLDQAKDRAIAILKVAKKRQEARMGGSGASTVIGAAIGGDSSMVALPGAIQSNIKTPLADLLGGQPFGGQALQGIANNAISYEQVSQLLQQPGQAQLAQQQGFMAGEAAFEQARKAGMKQVRKPVVVEKRDLRARRIVLED